MNDEGNTNNAGVPRQQEKKDRKLDNLINIVENHTRTQRHLEQYSEIGDPKHKENAKDKQNLREKQIDELKDQLIGNEQNAPTQKQQLEDVKENYQFGEGYIKSNKDHMSQEDLENLEQRQENRKIQIDNLEENTKQDN